MQNRGSADRLLTVPLDHFNSALTADPMGRGWPLIWVSMQNGENADGLLTVTLGHLDSAVMTADPMGRGWRRQKTPAINDPRDKPSAGNVFVLGKKCEP